MDIKTLTAESSVSPQILAADLRDLAQAGYRFGQLMAELPEPVHAFCRTGMRSSPPVAAVLEGHAQGSRVAGQARDDDMIGAWKWS